MVNGASLRTLIAMAVLLLCVSPPSRAKEAAPTLAECARRAEAFLLDAMARGKYSMSCESSGECMKCPLGGIPNVMVMSLLLDEIGAHPEADPEALAAAIEGMSRGGLWGFDKRGPVDTDDTSFALMSLHRFGRSADFGALLDMYEPEPEAFVTFRERRIPGWRYHLVKQRGQCPNENAMIHPEVNLNVYRAMQQAGMADMINYALIAELPEEDGHVSSMYYPSAYYGTWLAAEVLSRIDDPAGVADRVLGFVRATQNDDGSWGERDPWDTALALNALAFGSERGAQVEAGLRFLRSIQGADGGWLSDAVIWDYEVEFMGCSEEWRARDESGIIVTSMVMRAMRLLQEE